MKQRNLSFVLRVALCIVLLVVAYVLQCSLGIRFSIFGVHIDLLPLIVAAVGVVMGSGAGFVCGFAAGLLYDVSASGIEGIYPLYYLICGILCGTAGERFRNRQIRGTMLCSASVILALAAIRYLFLFQFSDMGILIFARNIAAQLLLAVVLSPIVLVVVRMVSGRKKTASISLEQSMEGGSNGPS
ncbi:MAG: rod shape-determining protein MreD [Clostridia bacterium]|nr:rod shape-determining protein MreD [Clostridia bacterium]